MNYLPNGIGASLGDSLVTAKPLQTTGDVWFVSSVNGVDALTPAGQSYERPLATLERAVGNAAEGDIIVLLPDHDETLTEVLVIDKVGLTIAGAGLVGGRPSPKLTNNQPGFAMLSLEAAGIEIRGIYFRENEQASSAELISVAAPDVSFQGCHFDCGENDGLAAILSTGAAARLRIRECLFISTGTEGKPNSAITLMDGPDDVHMEGVTVNGGSSGFASPAVDCSNGIMARIHVERMSLLNGADFLLHSASTGYVNVATATGSGSRVEW